MHRLQNIFGIFFATRIFPFFSFDRRRAGAEIDAHDMVLRFNSAPTRAYSAHVGNRTTYRVCNGEHMNIREGSEVVVHHLKARSFLRKFMLLASTTTARRASPPLLFHPDFTSYVAHTLSFIPSSGYFAIMMALQVGTARQLITYRRKKYAELKINIPQPETPNPGSIYDLVVYM
jgi:hypothetical protein